jgi:hypothetical protein
MAEETADDVTIRVTIEIPPRNEYTEDFYVDRAKWEAMTEDEKEDHFSKELFPTALSNSGVGGSYTLVENEDDA